MQANHPAFQHQADPSHGGHERRNSGVWSSALNGSVPSAPASSPTTESVGRSVGRSISQQVGQPVSRKPTRWRTVRPSGARSVGRNVLPPRSDWRRPPSWLGGHCQRRCFDGPPLGAQWLPPIDGAEDAPTVAGSPPQPVGGAVRHIFLHLLLQHLLRWPPFRRLPPLGGCVHAGPTARRRTSRPRDRSVRTDTWMSAPPTISTMERNPNRHRQWPALARPCAEAPVDRRDGSGKGQWATRRQ